MVTLQMFYKTSSISRFHFSFSNHNKNPLFSTITRIMSWTCSTCTFINPPSQKPTCQICLTEHPSPSPSSSSSSKPKWACNACTFLNPYQNTRCEICGTRESVSLLSTLESDDFDNDDDENHQLASSVGNVFLPLLLPCKRKAREENLSISSAGDVDGVDSAGLRSIKAAKKAVEELECATSEPRANANSKVLKIMSYNVWFREDLELHMRMRALGDLIQLHSPDFICFQEVTPDIYEIFQRSSWWKRYSCSVSSEMADTRPYFCMQLSKLPVKSYSRKPFHNSTMGRELCVAEVEVQPDRTLVVATSHLESPCPGPPNWDQMYSKERVEQAKETIQSLKSYANVIFCGDMNWDDKLDGQFPLTDGWIDAWSQLRPREVGYTYDTKSNKMLTGNRTLQKRLDRFVCKVQDFETSEIDMIGMDAIPGLVYCKEKKLKKEVKKLELPVLPSDHFGLLLMIRPK